MPRGYLLLSLLLGLLPPPACSDRPKNVLFLVVDDMRPQARAMGGGDDIHTPNMDKLIGSAGAVSFQRAFVQQAICCPSRTSFLTGRRPDTTKVWDLKTDWRGPQGGGNFTSLPEYFKLNGYRTAGGGKVFHPAPGVNDDVPYSWTEPYFQPQNVSYWDNFTHCWWAIPDSVPWFALPDGQVVQNALKSFEELSRTAPTTPFALFVGIKRPHLPFNAPKRFFDMYPLTGESVVSNKHMPGNWGASETYAWDASSGPRHMGTGDGSPLDGDIKALNLSRYELMPDVTALQMRRAYKACVSYVDELLGKVLSALEESSVADNTVTVLLGDHGWHLGEHGTFGKKTNFEIATRAPLVIRAPQFAQRPAAPASALVEFVDIFPTLVDLAGLPVPPLCPTNSSQVAVCTEGASLVPLLRKPSTRTDDFKKAIFSQYPPCMHDDMVWHDACENATEPRIMGYVVRTDSYRYIEWVGFNKSTSAPIWTPLLGNELYTHVASPNHTSVNTPDENENLAADPRYASVVQELSSSLHKGWRHFSPSSLPP